MIKTLRDCALTPLRDEDKINDRNLSNGEDFSLKQRFNDKKDW